jgi:hypothetical protein
MVYVGRACLLGTASPVAIRTGRRTRYQACGDHHRECERSSIVRPEPVHSAAQSSIRLGKGRRTNLTSLGLVIGFRERLGSRVDELERARQFRERALARRRYLQVRLRNLESLIPAPQQEIMNLRVALRHANSQLRFANRVIRELGGLHEYYEPVRGW